MSGAPQKTAKKVSISTSWTKRLYKNAAATALEVKDFTLQ